MKTSKISYCLKERYSNIPEFQELSEVEDDSDKTNDRHKKLEISYTLERRAVLYRYKGTEIIF